MSLGSIVTFQIFNFQQWRSLLQDRVWRCHKVYILGYKLGIRMSERIYFGSEIRWEKTIIKQYLLLIFGYFESITGRDFWLPLSFGNILLLFYYLTGIRGLVRCTLFGNQCQKRNQRRTSFHDHGCRNQEPHGTTSNNCRQFIKESPSNPRKSRETRRRRMLLNWKLFN